MTILSIESSWLGRFAALKMNGCNFTDQGNTTKTIRARPKINIAHAIRKPKRRDWYRLRNE
jgi:hypothetical protein